MGEELDPTTDPTEDPTEDTLASATDDTGADTPSDTTPTVDWEARYKAEQVHIERLSKALKQREDQILGLRTQPAHQDPAADDATALPPQVARELEDLRQWRAQQEWEAAVSEIGQPVADAYQVFSRGYQLDPTPKGALSAFVEAIQHLASTAPEGWKSSTKQTRSQAVQPRVDANRSDAPDLTDLDHKIEAAKAGKDTETPAQREKRLGSFIGNSLKKAGLSY